MPYFSVVSMDRRDAERAYPLVRTFAPDAPPELWSACVASCTDRGELLALMGADGGIFGLASCRLDDCAGAGRVLLVENFVTLELNQSGPGRRLLVGAIEDLAARWQCREIRQAFACGGHAGEGDRRLRNHLALVDASAGIRFSKGPDCSCGNLRSLTVAEMYPTR